MAGGSSRRRRAGVIGAVVGVAAAGVAAGVAAERLILRRTRMADTDLASEPFGRLPFDESLTVPTADGVDIHVEIVEPADGVDLPFDYAAGRRGRAGADARLRARLLPGHGHVPLPAPGSEPARRLPDGLLRPARTRPLRPAARRANTRWTMLARTLQTVIDETVPTGPIVLIGHSMGGMTIMALAEEHPELFGDRVRGVVFISTSAGKLDEVNFGMPDVLARFSRHLLPLISSTGRATGGVIDAARRASSDLAWLLTRKYGFGSNKAEPGPGVLCGADERPDQHRGGRAVPAGALHARAVPGAGGAERRCVRSRSAATQDQLTPLSHSRGDRSRCCRTRSSSWCRRPGTSR